MATDNLLTLEALKVLDAIARRGSFAAAAQELNKVPSAVSYTMQKLEDELDANIFDRSGHRAELTTVGQFLLSEGREILHSVSRLKRDAQSLSRGWETELTIVCDECFPIKQLLPLISQFRRLSNTSIRLLQGDLAGSWDALGAARIDLLIAPRAGQVSNRIKTQSLYQESLVLVAARDHSLHQHPDPLSDDELRHYPMIRIADGRWQGHPPTGYFLEQPQQLIVSTMEVMVQAVSAGLGIARIPASVAEQLEAQGRIRRVNNSQAMHIEVVLAWRRDHCGKGQTWWQHQLLERVRQPQAVS